MDGTAPTRPRRRRALATAAPLVVLLALTAAPAAHAGVLTSVAGSCSGQVYERPFTRWVDPLSYVLVPGGTFEAPAAAAAAAPRAKTARRTRRPVRRAVRRRAPHRSKARVRAAATPAAPTWTLTGGAAVVAGNEPFFVHGAGESRSLSLPAGSSATSPAMCVGLLHPTLRFFTLRSAALLSSLKVSVLFEDSLGHVVKLPIGIVPGSGAWQPTLPQVVVANLLANLPGGGAAAAFEFTPQGGASWRIDDVYVDPHRTR